MITSEISISSSTTTDIASNDTTAASMRMGHIKLKTHTKKPSISTSNIHQGSDKKQNRTDMDALWKWTFQKAALAPCFVRDALMIPFNGCPDMDFYWLGTVPCRCVKLVGLIAGIQQNEKRTLYTLDDGTSVIDCSDRHPPPSPRRARTSAMDMELPAPKAPLGSTVTITGKIVKWFETRQIVIDDIRICSSLNEQPLHWKHVLHLQKTYYSLPFEVPAPSFPEQNTEEQPKTSAKPKTEDKDLQQEQEQKKPSSSGPTSVRSKHNDAIQPPAAIRLRHPSKLRTKELTDITFRIYIKHYMDNAPSPIALHVRTSNDLGRPKDQLVSPQYDANVAAGKPAGLPAIGFTVSHLRRVPVLAELARKVVKVQELCIRKNLEKHKSKAKDTDPGSVAAAAAGPGKTNGSYRSSSSSGGGSVAKLSRHQVDAKVKRLFRSTIVHLFNEGSIVLYDGPARSLPGREEDAAMTGDYSALWNADTTATTTTTSGISGISSITSSSISRSQSQSQSVDGYISDPPPDEESYISLTPQYLAPHIERILASYMARNRGVLRHAGAGLTKENILSSLRKSDGRWERLGEWAVADGLALLKEEGRAYTPERGRWILCA